MPTLALKLFARQSTVRMDGQSGDYMLPPLGSIIRGYYTATVCQKVISAHPEIYWPEGQYRLVSQYENRLKNLMSFMFTSV